MAVYDDSWLIIVINAQLLGVINADDFNASPAQVLQQLCQVSAVVIPRQKCHSPKMLHLLRVSHGVGTCRTNTRTIRKGIHVECKLSLFEIIINQY